MFPVKMLKRLRNKENHAFDIWLNKRKINAMYKPLFDAEIYTTDDWYAL